VAVRWGGVKAVRGGDLDLLVAFPLVACPIREGGVVKVAVFGLGYVGTVTAACLASNGHDVWGVDPEQAKVDAIGRGESTVVEPGLDDPRG
jgi:threonine dehydrogenase-like Zn-dependent dehydrogenase